MGHQQPVEVVNQRLDMPRLGEVARINRSQVLGNQPRCDVARRMSAHAVHDGHQNREVHDIVVGGTITCEDCWSHDCVVFVAAASVADIRRGDDVASQGGRGHGWPSVGTTIDRTAAPHPDDRAIRPVATDGRRDWSSTHGSLGDA